MGFPPAEGETSGHAGGMASVPARRRIGRLLLPLILATAGGSAAFFAADRYREFFRLRPEADRLAARMGLSAAEQETLDAARQVQSFQNAALVYAIFGGIVGGALGLAAGLSRRSAMGVLAGVVTGSGLGAVLGGAAGLTARALDDRFGVYGEQFAYALMWYGAAFLIAGLGIGLGAGLAAGRFGPTVLAVAAAGLVAGLLFPVIAAVAFPFSPTDGTLPIGRGALAVWAIFPASLMGLAAGRTWAGDRHA